MENKVKRLKGIVIKLIRDRGYGFIRSEDDRMRFMHVTDVVDWDHMAENIEVTFIPSGESIAHRCPHCGSDVDCDSVKNNRLRALKVQRVK